MPVQIDQEIEESCRIGQAGGDCRAGDLISGRQDDEHEERIQYNFEDAAHGHAETCLFCRADGADQMTAEDISDSGDRTDDHGPEHVVIYILVRSVVSSDDRNETAAEEYDQQTEGNRGGDPRVKAEGEGLSGIREILASQSPGNDAGAADAEEVGDGCQEHKDRHADRQGSHHGGTAGPSDVPGIRKIVYNIDELCDDRGDSQCHDGDRDRRGLENGHILTPVTGADWSRHSFYLFM